MSTVAWCNPDTSSAYLSLENLEGFTFVILARDTQIKPVSRPWEARAMAGVIECASCGTSFPAGTRFCSECGATLTGALVRQATGMLPANQLLQDRYLILKKLAQGGQSAVYLVADTLDDSAQYAMKEMSESELSLTERKQAIADFQREADMLRLLNHPALAKVYSTFVED